MLATLFYHQPSFPSHLADSISLHCKDYPKRFTNRLDAPNRRCQQSNISKYDKITNSDRFFVSDNDENCIEVSLDIPGIKIDDLSVKVENGIMTVSGQRTIGIGCDSTSSKRRRVLHRFKINERIDPENVTANLVNGVLTISLPKTELPKPLQIQVIENNNNNIVEVNGHINQSKIQNHEEISNDDDLVIVETVQDKEEVVDENNRTMKS